MSKGKIQTLQIKTNLVIFFTGKFSAFLSNKKTITKLD